MKASALACARYWRNTLADAELGRGALGLKYAVALHPISPAALSKGRVGHEVIAALFIGNYSEAESIAVTLRPLVYRSRTEHGRLRLTLPAVVTPIVSKATLMRDGRLLPPMATVVPRDLLEPLDHTAFTIGTVDALDGFLTRHGDGPETPADDSRAAPNWNAYPLLARHETSLAYHGRAAAGDIEAMKASLQHRAGSRQYGNTTR